DQQQTEMFRGDEEFALRHLHPEKEWVRGQLPGLRTRCFWRSREDAPGRLREIEMRATTLWLFPHRECGVLIYQGNTPIEYDDAWDVAHLLGAIESLEPDSSEVRDLFYYESEFARRLDSEKGPLAALDDRPLVPHAQRVTD